MPPYDIAARIHVAQPRERAMFKMIEGLPPDVLAVEATGKITHDDYVKTLIPSAEAIVARGPLKALFVIGKELTGFELEALWDDAAFGLTHWRNFSRVAVVTDHAWIRAMTGMFTPLMPAEVRLFGLADLPSAKAWIAGARREGA